MNAVFTGLLIFLGGFWVLSSLYHYVKGWLAQRLLIRQTTLLKQAAEESEARSVILIIPVKGIPEYLDAFLKTILEQKYPDYRVILVTESEKDPATSVIREALSERESEVEVEVVVAGLATDQGQKVHNQLAALKKLRESDRIVAFADADIVEGRKWLIRLVTPLNAELGELSSGYRWFIPRDRKLGTLLGTAINAGIAMMQGPSWHALLWGGSMAMTRECFEELKIPDHLRGSLNDDAQISHVARKAGKKIIPVRSLLAPTPVSYSIPGLVEFGRRQYFQIRVYVPAFWWLALLIVTMNALGPLAVLTFAAWTGSWKLAIGAFLVVFFLQALAQKERARFLRLIHSPRTVYRLKTAMLLELEPVTTLLRSWIHLLCVLASGPIKVITWAGIRYRVTGRQKCEVLHHPSASPTDPA